jgi:hypothetical protein
MRYIFLFSLLVILTAMAFPRTNYLQTDFYEEHAFFQAILKARAYPVEGKIKSGVVPHDLTAAGLIANFFKTAAENRKGSLPETIVIIAPMHYPNRQLFITTMDGWATPGGCIPNDAVLSELFIQELGAGIDNDAKQTDHSVAALVPFVKQYFPEAALASLLVSGFTDESVSERVAVLLNEYAAEKNCLFIFSIDFSHFLSPPETERRDAETRMAVQEYEIKKISRMGNDHLDSPRSFAAFMYLNKLMNGEIVELDNSNSFKLSDLAYPHPVFAEGLTSYFIWASLE